MSINQDSFIWKCLIWNEVTSPDMYHLYKRLINYQASVYLNNISIPWVIMMSYSGGSLCVYFWIWSNIYRFYKSVIISGTHCQSILQFLGKLEKFMEEKHLSKAVKYKNERVSSGLGKHTNCQHEKDASGIERFTQCLPCSCTLCRNGSTVHC